MMVASYGHRGEIILLRLRRRAATHAPHERQRSRLVDHQTRGALLAQGRGYSNRRKMQIAGMLIYILRIIGR